MLKDYATICVKNLFHRKLRSWLTIIGILIGITAVIALMSLGIGMKDAITKQFESLGTNRIIVQAKGGEYGPPGQLAAVKLMEKDLNTVKKSNGVRNAVGRLIKSARMEFNDKVSYVFLVSIPDEEEEIDFIYNTLNLKASEGRLLRNNDRYKIMVGSEYSKENRFGRQIKSGDKMNIEGKDFEVVGVVDKTGNPQIDIAITMPENVMRELLKIEDEYSIIVAESHINTDPEIVAENIKKDLRNERKVEEEKEDFAVQTSKELLDSLKRILNIVQVVLVGIAAISLIIGGIGIANTMYTAVVERTREIGIMKAIGADRGDIITIFLIESGIVGVVGGALGILFGYGISKLVEIVSAQQLGIVLIKAVLPLHLIIVTLLFSFIIGCISGTMPAIQASRLDPVEALRK